MLEWIPVYSAADTSGFRNLLKRFMAVVVAGYNYTLVILCFGNQTQGFGYIRQVFYQLSHVSSLSFETEFNRMDVKNNGRKRKHS